MGDPKKLRKKYTTPTHPWQRARMEEESAYKKEYGVKNKKKIWILTSNLKNFSTQTKKLIATKSMQAEKEKQQLLKKLFDLSLLEANAKLEDVLSIKEKDLFERTLQTLIFRKGMARSIKQARQFIVHQHIMVNGRIINSPSYLVSREEEKTIEFSPTSTLASAEHPERAAPEKKPAEAKK
jgi:small subunit ribosomal protein S4